jgi:uncharacterized membrane protein YkoI
MKKSFALALILSFGLSAAPSAAMVARDEQGKARKEMRDGNVLPLREIEGRIVPRMRGMEYLGPEYDPDARVYRLKFINSGRVIFVDVDARTGTVLRQR